jgi:tetratricopeptide (TPR) repeat protein
MLIVQIEPPSLHLQGDQIYRTVQPCRSLAGLPDTQVLSGFWLQPACRAAAAVADVLILCQAVEADLLPLLAARRAAGRPTVFEINDDFSATQSWNRCAGFCANPLMLALTHQLAAQATAVQYSSHGLQRRFGFLHDTGRLSRNSLWTLPPAARKNRSGVVRVGFAGSPGHREDVRSVVDLLAQVMQSQPNWQFCSMVQADMRSIFAPLPAARCHHVDPGDMQAYQNFVGTLDIGLAPLLPTPFNEGRSDVKFLEYSAGGAAVLASAQMAYAQSLRHGDNGLLFANEAQFVAGLVALLQQPELRQRLVASARQDIANGRLQHQKLGADEQFLRSLCLPPKASDPASRAPVAAQAEFEALVAQHSNVQWHAPRYARLAPGPKEAALMEAMQQPKESPRATAACQAAISAAPENYLGYLLLGQCTSDLPTAMRAFKQALALHPASCGVRHAQALRAQAAGNPQAAAAAHRQNLQITPSWAPAYEALAAQALQRQDTATGTGYLQAALQANPYQRSAACHLALLALQGGKPQRARQQLLETLAAHLDTATDHYLLGEIYILENKLAEAHRHLLRAQSMGGTQPRLGPLLQQAAAAAW